MERSLYPQLVAWKHGRRRKPLLLTGARQTGKTYLLKWFGAREYRRTHYFNFEKDPGLNSFFEGDLEPGRILRDLGLYRDTDVTPGDLLIFDEIQASNRALNSLKYFQEEANEYHVAAAGSLLGVELAKPSSFPVGKVNLAQLHPMTFFEFLNGVGAGRYRAYLEELEEVQPLPDAFHSTLIGLLRAYYVVGGMPEAVSTYAAAQDFAEVRTVQDEILRTYVADFAKHTPAHDIPKLRQIWASLPMQLARENKRFLFCLAREGARAREYEDALLWLEGAGLVYRSFAVETARLPLKAHANRQLFKVYMLDTGLLGAMANLAPRVLVLGDTLFREYHGAFVENYAAQTLAAELPGELYYWRNKRSTAEVDFLCEIDSRLIPLEAKAGVNPRSKSLRTLGQACNAPHLFRTTLLNLMRQDRLTNLPLYALQLLPRLAAGPPNSE